MRALLLLILGLGLGVFAGLSIARQASMLRAYPRGVMNVLQHHLTAARDELQKGDACAAAQLQQNLQALQRFSTEVEPALNPPGSKRDAELDRLQQELINAMKPIAKLSDLSSCARVDAKLITAIDQTCRDCHLAYR